MSVEFITSLFYATHLRMPRGQGQWAFIDSQKASRDDYLKHVFWVNDSLFRNAKKRATRHFAAKGVRSVVVLP